MLQNIRLRIAEIGTALRSRNTLKILVPIIIVLGTLLVAFWAAIHSPIFIDDDIRYNHSRWLLGELNLIHPPPPLVGRMRLYAPLWEMVLGVATELVFPLFNDPYWVRHALTFSLFPLTLYGLFVLLRRNGYSRSGSFLATACVFGCIRLGGHSFFNMKDAPSALSYLFVSTWTWTLFSEGMQKGFTAKRLALLGIVSVLPFLIRSPLLTHFVLILGVMLAVALFDKQSGRSTWQRASLVLIPMISGLGLIALLYPTMWSTDPSDWIRPFTLFSDYPWHGAVRIFGMGYRQNTLPWWYAIAWIFIGIHPLALALALLGCVSPFLLRRRNKTLLDISVRGRVISLSLHRWLWLITIVSWSAVLIIHPSLYNEDRHILFLYPLLIFTCALGLEAWESWEKYLMATILILLSTMSYAEWGKYSYVYKSPFIGNIHAEAFTGDYWDTCMYEAVRALPSLVKTNTTIQVIGYPKVAEAALQIMKQSVIRKVPSMGNYTFVLSPPTAFPYVRIANSEAGAARNTLEAIKTGDATSLWQENMPPGDPACIIAIMRR